MLRRLFCPILVAAVVLTAALGVTDRAAAAIRITMSDGINEKVFYHSAEDGMAPVLTSLGDFEVVFQATSTNFPGEAGRGELVQVITLTDINPTGSVLPQFTFSSAVIETVDGVSNGQVTDPTQLAAVVGADLLRFTTPADSQLSVSSQVIAGDLSLVGTGTVQNHTQVNGVTVSSGVVDVNSGENGLNQGTAPNGVSPDGYTLSTQVVLDGATVGGNPLVIRSDAFVTGLTPEPGSLAVWGLGALGLAIAGAARRRFPSAKS